MAEGAVQSERSVALARPSYLTLTDASVEALRKAIQDGLFAPGSQLPPEKDLVSRLGVSRTTLREALRVLDQQGLIVRRRGLGTFVVETPMMKDLSNNFGITAMVKEAGYAPESHPGTVRTEKASKQLTSAFPSLPEGTPIIVVDRIRTANQRPVVWSLDVVPIELLGAPALRGFDPTRHSLYQFLANELSIRVVRGLAELHPVAATKDLAAKLGVRRGSPLMRIIQTDYDTNSRPVLYSIEYHVPDAFVFLVNRMGPYR